MARRVGSMTASGPSLREAIYMATGCDAYEESDFVWSDYLRCDECGVSDSTALLSFDGDTFVRVCFHCYVER